MGGNCHAMHEFDHFCILLLPSSTECSLSLFFCCFQFDTLLHMHTPPHPRTTLCPLTRLPRTPNRVKQTIETQWRLTCELALPWRPFIDVEGGTVHRYDPSKGGRVVEHVESWAVSGFEAVLQLFRPGKGRPAEEGPSEATKVKSGFRLLANTVLPISLSLLSSNAFTGSSSSSSGNPFVAAVYADDKRQVADIPASGLIFKDAINVEAFPDPKVKGVTIYVSDFRRPLAERLAKDFFSDPSQASVACVGSGTIKMSNVRPWLWVFRSGCVYPVPLPRVTYTVTLTLSSCVPHPPPPRIAYTD